MAFRAVQAAEVEALQKRRDWAHGPENHRPEGAGNQPVAPVGPRSGDLQSWNTVGLSLSGGGIRSATFSLGVLQALDAHKLIGQFDYLSTVSGGGYFGAALSSTLQQSKGQFVFGSPATVRDTDSVGYLRNFSNYLLPRSQSSLRNASEAAAVVGRGLVTNFFIVAGVVLLLAFITAIAYGSPAALHGSFPIRFIDGMFGLFGWRPFGTSELGDRGRWLDRRFLATGLVLLLLVLVQAAWAVRRSIGGWPGTDVSGPFLTIVSIFMPVLVVVAFLDLQPAVIDITIHREWLHGWMAFIGKYVLVPSGVVATVASFLSGQIATFLKSTQSTGRKRVVVARLAAKLVILVAAVFVPLMVYLAYVLVTAHLIVEPSSRPALAVLCVFLIVVSVCFSPNANSLHRFYRDRLSQAFLFKQVDAAVREHRGWDWKDLVRPAHTMASASATTAPDEPTWSRPTAGTSVVGNRSGTKLVPRDPIALTELDSCYTPFHLLNTTLNLQASLHANKRGRDCDFFVFTPKHFGGDLLGFYDIKTSPVDLATAVAVSGAAASSAMGGLKLFKALAPTLALLNVRLGYWLDNPRRRTGRTLVKAFKTQMYLLAEMLQLIDEESDLIYLTDGGHIENLGVYELFRRGCKLIVAVDAETDPDIACGSLIAMERYARIDFGTRIDIAVDAIAAANNAVDTALDAGQAIPAAAGPHATLGRIHYPDGTTGFLLYIKASLSGDEPDYVMRYKKANPAFPHETTGDQFFSEEQFECYRALGFHMVDRIFGRLDPVACPRDDSGCHALAAGMWDALLHRV